MGSVKRELEREAHDRSLTNNVLLEFGYLRRCPLHEETLINQLVGPPSETDGDEVPRMLVRLREMGFEGPWGEVLEALDDACNEAGDSCGTCQKNADS